jgi:hypothetical protein
LSTSCEAGSPGLKPALAGADKPVQPTRRAMSNPPSVPQDPAAERLRGRLMQQSLGQLLDRVRGSREVLPHLAALENSLGRHGTAVIASIPASGLAKICSQLSSLPLPKDDPPLHDLLTRLMDALEATRPRRSSSPPSWARTPGHR